MKLEVRKTKKEELLVRCPRLDEEVDSYNVCHHCDWLSIATAEYVRCRWTKEKEETKTGRRYYEAT